jgi:hypothetical protein
LSSKRKRPRAADQLKAPTSTYADPELGALELRGAMTPKTRTVYAEIGGVREDAWQRQVEFLYERLVVSWTIHDLPITKQKELLARFRVATQAERTWIRNVLREHLSEHFPEMQTP